MQGAWYVILATKIWAETDKVAAIACEKTARKSQEPVDIDHFGEIKVAGPCSGMNLAGGDVYSCEEELCSLIGLQRKW